MFLIVLATINPSLALLLALPTVPVYISVRPCKSILLYLVQSGILMFLSPPVLLAGFGLFDRVLATQFLVDANHYWELYGALLLPVICLYWPFNIAAQTLISMEL